jgi:methionyl aminopeptidase
MRLYKGVYIKNDDEIKTLVEGGRRLSRVKGKLKDMVAEGISAYEIEQKATELIKKSNAIPSFKMVEGYNWSTCVNVNGGVVHGIPSKKTVFAKGDLVSVDVGLYYKGFHTDTSFSVGVGVLKPQKRFLSAGEKALAEAIGRVKEGKRVFDISKAIEETISKFGYNPVKALVGHGVGKSLHEEPQIPCFTSGRREETVELKNGMALAIEVMYVLGSEKLILSDDGWTISTVDGKISALFEETVVVTPDGPLVITR